MKGLIIALCLLSITVEAQQKKYKVAPWQQTVYDEVIFIVLDRDNLNLPEHKVAGYVEKLWYSDNSGTIHYAGEFNLDSNKKAFHPNIKILTVIK